MMKLKDLVQIKGISIGKTISVLALIFGAKVLKEITFEGFDFANPMVSKEAMEIDFTVTIPKDMKVKVKVLSDMYKEMVQELKVKDKLKTEVYKAIAYGKKKLGVSSDLEIAPDVVEAYVESVEVGYSNKITAFEILTQIVGLESVKDYTSSLINEYEVEMAEKEQIKLELMDIMGEESDEVVLEHGEEVVEVVEVVEAIEVETIEVEVDDYEVIDNTEEEYKEDLEPELDDWMKELLVENVEDEVYSGDGTPTRDEISSYNKEELKNLIDIARCDIDSGDAEGEAFGSIGDWELDRYNNVTGIGSYQELINLLCYQRAS